MAITRSELIQIIAKRFPYLSVEDVRVSVTAILDGIRDAMIEGRRTELRGFGCFTVKHQDARNARNPRTGQIMVVGEKLKPHFQAGRELQVRVMHRTSPARTTGPRAATGSGLGVKERAVSEVLG